ncbi:hypothetical protein PG997_001603 [Apiospora hydei]|uniref:Transposase n=1 Tax=Apiospora hydei TaxID=1337664 RepID=A0ABR1XEF8_9PEZI
MLSLVPKRRKRRTAGSAIHIPIALGIRYVAHSEMFDLDAFARFVGYINIGEEDLQALLPRAFWRAVPERRWAAERPRWRWASIIFRWCSGLRRRTGAT